MCWSYCSLARSHWNVISIITQHWEGGRSLTHWGRVTHIYVGNVTIIGSDNGLSPGRRQAFIWTNVGLLSIATLGTNFSEILIEIQTFSYKKMHLIISSGKWRPFCLGLNVLNPSSQKTRTCLSHLVSASVCISLINSSPPSAAYMRQCTGSSLFQVMACRLFSAKPLPEPTLIYSQLNP